MTLASDRLPHTTPPRRRTSPSLSPTDSGQHLARIEFRHGYVIMNNCLQDYIVFIYRKTPTILTSDLRETSVSNK